VWLERSQERTDFRGIAGEAFTFEFALDTRRIASEREPCIFNIESASQDHGGGIDRVVQSIAKIARSVLSNRLEFARNLSGEPDLMNVLLRVIIKLDNTSVWFECPEGRDLSVQSLRVFVTALDESLWTGEVVYG
jgi:hypothetical protein